MADICYYVLTNGVLATLFAVCIALSIRHFPALRRPAVRHLLWVIVLLRLLSPPIVPFDVSPAGEWAVSSLQRHSERQDHVLRYTVTNTYKLLQTIGEATQTNHLVPMPSFSPEAGTVAISELSPTSTVVQSGIRNARVARTNLDWLAKRLFFPAWAFGAAICFLAQTYVAVQFSRSIRTDGYSSRIWQRRAERVAKRMGLSNCPKLLLVRAKISPMLWGFGRGARILFPEKLLLGLSVRAQDTLIAHELAHYRRGDQWVRLLELASMIVFWWNPVFWFARREIERAEETCCDAWAVRQANGCPRTYADALLSTVDFLSAGFVPPVASPAGKGEFLRERLHAIMRGRRVGGRALLPDSYPGVIVLAMLVMVPTPFFSHSFGGGKNQTVVNSNWTAGDSDPVRARVSTETSNRIPGGKARHSNDSDQGVVQLELDEINRAVFRNVETGCVRELGIGRVASADFSSDGHQLALGLNDGTVEIIDCSSGQTERRMRIGNSKIDSISLSSDNALLAVGTRDGRFRLLSLQSGLDLTQHQLDPSQPDLVQRKFPGQRVRSVRFARNGKSVAVIWQRKTRNRLEILDLADGSIKSSSWSRTEFEAVFDDVASKTSPPLWRVATTQGRVLGFDEVADSGDFQELPYQRVTTEQLREFRIQSQPNSTLE